MRSCASALLFAVLFVGPAAAQEAAEAQAALRAGDYEEAIEQGSDKSLTFHRYANILDNLGEHEKARENWERAIELDPLIADYYIQLGESHLRDSRAADSFEVGEGYLRLALDIEPDNFYLEQNLESLLQAGRKARNKKSKKSKPKGDSDAE